MPFIPKPILYLRMEGDATDSSGYDNHGSVTDATLTTDRWGHLNSAYNFNGTSAYIDCGNNSSLNMTTALSVEYVLLLSEQNDVGKELINKGSGALVKNFNFYTRINVAEQFEGGFGDGTDYKTIKADLILTTNKWYHVVFIFDIPNVYIHSQGNQINTSSLGSATTSLTNSDNLILGYRGTAFFPGIIEFVKMYNVVLTPTQVKYLYNRAQSNYGGLL